MKVVGYLRVSTEEQEQSGLGLEDQAAKINSYCDLYELDLMSIFQDTASGKAVHNRNGLQEALTIIKKDEAEGLIVAKLDRLTRSVRDLGTLLHHYFEKSYSLFVVQEQVDTRTASGRLMLNLLTSVAQWEREIIGERTRDALRAKRKRGEKTGGDVPFGYDLAQDGRLVENRKEQVVIYQMKILRNKGYGYQRTAYALNQMGHRTKRGKLWNHVTAGRLVRRIEDGRL
jgi:DNA invertase Pin-like site-specific DNA recombinase